MDLLLYVIFSAVYIMVIHFAVAIRNHFDVFLMIGLFVLGGVIGWQMHSYELGFVFAMVASLLFW
ncbi:hypothetical protein M1523_04490 [Patescibacteria group bacterium]|nr:hypothetical protein [Patescibacteria group bacterium]MCL5091519.1 hypothetical protein [Patescibacteria group bacterium]